MDPVQDSETEDGSLELADESMLMSDAETLKDAAASSDDNVSDASVGGDDSRCETSTKTSVNSKQDRNEVCGDYWDPEEKALLLAFVKQFGMLNLNALAAILKTKNVQQIRAFFNKVTRAVASERVNRARRRTRQRMVKLMASRAAGTKPRKTPVNIVKEKKKWIQVMAEENGEGPIDWWLSHMENTLAKKTKQSNIHRKSARHLRAISEMIPRACSIISQYEDHPNPRLCSGVDYKEAYDCLYHVLSGVPPKSLSAPTAAFIQRSIERLRNRMLDGMYSREYSKYFGAQVDYIKMAAKPTRPCPAQTYGARTKNSVLAMAQSDGLPNPSQCMESLMTTAGFNLMKVPDSLTWRLGHENSREKYTPRRKYDLKKKICPPGIFCETDIFAGPSKTDT